MIEIEETAESVQVLSDRLIRALCRQDADFGRLLQQPSVSVSLAKRQGTESIVCVVKKRQRSILAVKFHFDCVKLDDSFSNFQKESWIASIAPQELGVPTTYSVGKLRFETASETRDISYLIQQFINFEPVSDQSVNLQFRLDFASCSGQIARMIHSIPAKGFGTKFTSKIGVFDKDSWQEVICGWKARVEFGELVNAEILTLSKIDLLNQQIQAVANLTCSPKVSHNDFLHNLSNVLWSPAQNKPGAILDWTKASSGPALVSEMAVCRFAFIRAKIEPEFIELFERNFLRGYSLCKSVFDIEYKHDIEALTRMFVLARCSDLIKVTPENNKLEIKTLAEHISGWK